MTGESQPCMGPLGDVIKIWGELPTSFIIEPFCVSLSLLSMGVVLVPICLGNLTEERVQISVCVQTLVDAFTELMTGGLTETTMGGSGEWMSMLSRKASTSSQSSSVAGADGPVPWVATGELSVVTQSAMLLNVLVFEEVLCAIFRCLLRYSLLYSFRQYWHLCTLNI